MAQDLNDPPDGVIDLHDLKILSSEWMFFEDIDSGDLDGDGKVNALDFRVLAENWRVDRNIPPILINEFVADNVNGSGIEGMEDPEGQAEDWIELYNFGDDPIDLAGMFITDDPDEREKYMFPVGLPLETTIAAGGYLVLWADNDTADGPLHLSFKLSAGGEQILLYKTDGYTLVDSVVFGSQKENLSLGRDLGSSPVPKDQDWAFLTLPTPGVVNESAYSGLVESVTSSLERGYHDGSQAVVLYCPTPGATIYYTLDGSSPELNGSPAEGFHTYSGPLTVDATTTLRAVGMMDGHRPSKVTTWSYLFLEDIRNQSDTTATARSFPSAWTTANFTDSDGYPDYAMDPNVLTEDIDINQFDTIMKSIPTVSLVTDIDHFFDPDTGIYSNIYGYHNTNGNWEREVSMEIFDPITEETIQVDCAIRLVGNASRHQTNSKHSMRVSFKDSYGPSKLSFPLFPGSSVEDFDTIALRSQYHMSWPEGEVKTQYTRDPYVHETQRAMGHLAPRTRFVHLYINGLYWGLYEAAERPDNEFLASHEGGNPDDYEVVEGILKEPRVEWKGPGDETWTTLWDLVTPFSASNPVDAATYQQIEALLDLDQFIDTIILNSWLTNYDWGAKNWYAGSQRPIVQGGAPARKWQFYPWDSEKTMQGTEMLPLPFSESYTGGPKIIHNALHGNEQYRLRFADRIQMHCIDDGGALTLPEARTRYNDLVAEIYEPVIAESARWGDFVQDHTQVREHLEALYKESEGDEEAVLFPDGVPLFTRGVHFDHEWDFFETTYFSTKVANAVAHYQAAGLYPLSPTPVSALAGNQITLSGNGDIYYTTDGSDVIVYTGPEVQGKDIPLVSTTTLRKYLVPTGAINDAWKGGASFVDSTWDSAEGGIGYEKGTNPDPDYSTLFVADVEAMYGSKTSCYIRVPFEILNPQDLEKIRFLRLRVQYDSGFVTYLNGVKGLSVNAPALLDEDAIATADHADYLAVEVQEFDLADLVDDLKLGDNILAIHALNSDAYSSDFLMSFELVGKQGITGRWQFSPSAQPYSGPLNHSQTTTLRARSLENEEWSALSSKLFTYGSPVNDLRITELMFNPEIPDTEYIELMNTGSTDLDLEGVNFSNGVSYTFSSQMLAAGERILLVEDLVAFEDTYGTGLSVDGEYTGALKNSGEKITLLDATGTIIQSFSYKDGWYDSTDGGGYSLTLRDPSLADPVLWSEKESWKPSAHWAGSPGIADHSDVPLPGTVVVNEVLAHSDSDPNDWIELHNNGSTPVDLSGWFLSDDLNARTKYRIADGTSLSAGGFIVFTQDGNFGWDSMDSGKLEDFALSENGDLVVITAKMDGEHHLGYFEQEDFGASDREVSMGRHLKSTGTTNFVALSAKTSGSANALPKVGPIVISEIQYHPDWPTDNTYTNEDYEYIRLTNIDDESVTLYDSDASEPWKLHGAIDFLFPADTPIVLEVDQSLYVVKNIAAFHARYTDLPENTIVVGPFTGNLSNGGESLTLSKPGDIDTLSVQHFIRVDRVVYGDDIELWPPEADGEGDSLQRINNTIYGNDPANWNSGTPSPKTYTVP
jgi:hypothetical protein